MRENIENLLNFIKKQPIRGCITGSILLDIFEGEKQDVDIFCYDESSFRQLIFAMHHNENFTILEELEKWKFKKYINDGDSSFYKLGLVSIKFLYNTYIELNVIYKKKANNIFSVLSSFDMDIICKGYDIETKKVLDLSEHLSDKKATWNKWNVAFYNDDIWNISRILRQLERCFKYYKRGYNTDDIVLKYITMINNIKNYNNIFKSENFEERLQVMQNNTEIVKQICLKWLETHEITDNEIKLLNDKVKEI